MTHSVIVEMRPRLQVCNAFIITKECLKEEESVKINIKTSGVDITWVSENCEILQIINLHGYKLKPTSLSALQVQKNSISFRLQTEPVFNTFGSFSREILPFDNSLGNINGQISIPAPDISSKEPCRLACKCCGKVVSRQDLSFGRVLPLPSSDSSDWFCHEHSSCSNLKYSNILPKENDCFYGDFFILLSSVVLDISAGPVIRCSRCMSWLGTCTNSTAKLWDCTTSYEGKSNSTALQHFMITVQNAFKSSFDVVCRVVLETRLSEKESQYLLLWAMDKNLDLLVSVNEDDFSSTEEYVGQLRKVTTECKLKVKKCLKLLYMYHRSCSDLVKSWRADCNVQCIEIAKPMFTEGLDYLMRGTQFIPDPHKVTNNFFVTYLGI